MLVSSKLELSADNEWFVIYMWLLIPRKPISKICRLVNPVCRLFSYRPIKLATTCSSVTVPMYSDCHKFSFYLPSKSWGVLLARMVGVPFVPNNFVPGKGPSSPTMKFSGSTEHRKSKLWRRCDEISNLRDTNSTSFDVHVSFSSSVGTVWGSPSTIFSNGPICNRITGRLLSYACPQGLDTFCSIDETVLQLYWSMLAPFSEIVPYMLWYNNDSAVVSLHPCMLLDEQQDEGALLEGRPRTVCIYGRCLDASYHFRAVPPWTWELKSWCVLCLPCKITFRGNGVIPTWLDGSRCKGCHLMMSVWTWLSRMLPHHVASLMRHRTLLLQFEAAI